MTMRPLGAAVALVTAAGVASPMASAAAGEPADGPAAGVVYSARKPEAQVRLIGLGDDADGQALVLLDVRVACEGFNPQGRMVATVEDGGRFEVEGRVSDPGTTDVITGEFDDIDGRVREDGVVLEIDVEVEGEDNAGSTGRCEETQQWRLEPRRSTGVRLVEGATATEASVVAADADALYTLVLGDDRGGELARLDPRALEEIWSLDASANASTVAASGDAVWVLDDQSFEVTRYAADTGEEVATVPLESPEAAERFIATSPPTVATPSALWVAISDTESVYRIDAATNEVTIGTVPGRITGLAPASDGVYAAIGARAGTGARLVRIDEQTDEVASVSVEGSPEAVAVGASTVWTRSSASVAAYDPTTLEPIGVAAIGPTAAQLSAALAGTSPGVWAATERGLVAFDDTVTRALVVPVITAGSSGLAAGPEAVYAIDAGYLIRLVAGDA